MSVLRRTSMEALRAVRARGAGPYQPGGFWGPGTQPKTAGYLFGETPLPKGVKRQWEDWEYVYTPTMILAGVMLAVGLNAKPNTNITAFAKEEAERRLQAEGKL
mmetsp:Transcript_21853/g.26317  ORF Transcript_21853/g.26317 Transcript_21853/m.26317 type:complete len:104 (-) Transcript_21853:294-605(-)|eukprot:CAMPEP_0197851650 /NCGR_PEP_ID=MMETSP1438-20131217/18538_1 /TAXON_ID=1461541 /ORGANISM="Pterosperma sp., Strain CCMP1384" /LENGTH=103 /DNA_ID=CAMNT_0043465335 /DNA_START=117 /DNA_END=428 /DNA_ORIENTATION=-